MTSLMEISVFDATVAATASRSADVEDVKAAAGFVDRFYECHVLTSQHLKRYEYMLFRNEYDFGWRAETDAHTGSIAIRFDTDGQVQLVWTYGSKTDTGLGGRWRSLGRPADNESTISAIIADRVLEWLERYD
ncbi:MAG: hypothetical protein KF794_05255 [Xanthobacteraceae bacterium]|nr:hypothetical protein [Xanthobacteraceae bacterium]QYK46099.1 MAG: hypothetical protein KF794_05255 [Xanthobacteraceae bacterium]